MYLIISSFRFSIFCPIFKVKTIEATFISIKVSNLANIYLFTVNNGSSKVWNMFRVNNKDNRNVNDVVL